MKPEYEIIYLQQLNGTKKSSYFYGGRMVEIVLDKDHSYLISACGDVDAVLFDDNGNIIEEVRDRNNCGAFSYEMQHITEENLYDLLDSGKLVMNDNNWWEVNGLYKGKFVEFPLLDNVLDSMRIDDAIEEVLAADDYWQRIFHEILEEAGA